MMLSDANRQQGLSPTVIPNLLAGMLVPQVLGMQFKFGLAGILPNMPFLALKTPAGMKVIARTTAMADDDVLWPAIQWPFVIRASSRQGVEPKAPGQPSSNKNINRQIAHSHRSTMAEPNADKLKIVIPGVHIGAAVRKVSTNHDHRWNPDWRLLKKQYFRNQTPAEKSYSSKLGVSAGQFLNKTFIGNVLHPPRNLNKTISNVSPNADQVAAALAYHAANEETRTRQRLALIALHTSNNKTATQFESGAHKLFTRIAGHVSLNKPNFNTIVLPTRADDNKLKTSESMTKLAKYPNDAQISGNAPVKPGLVTIDQKYRYAAATLYDDQNRDLPYAGLKQAHWKLIHNHVSSLLHNHRQSVTGDVKRLVQHEVERINGLANEASAPAPLAEIEQLVETALPKAIDRDDVARSMLSKMQHLIQQERFRMGLIR